VGREFYFDSLSNDWKHYNREEIKADIIWNFLLTYKLKEKTYFCPVAPNAIFLFLPENPDSIPLSINYEELFSDTLATTKFAGYGYLHIDETKYQKLKVKFGLVMRNCETNEIIDTFQIQLIADLKEGHGSKFMK